MSAGEAFTAGFGLAIGLLMGQHLLRTVGLPTEVVAKRVILCPKCDIKNPIGNKFCNHCGQSLYPPSRIKCQGCLSEMLVIMKFCGNCGTVLRK